MATRCSDCSDEMKKLTKTQRGLLAVLRAQRAHADATAAEANSGRLSKDERTLHQCVLAEGANYTSFDRRGGMVVRLRGPNPAAEVEVKNVKVNTYWALVDAGLAEHIKFSNSLGGGWVRALTPEEIQGKNLTNTKK